MQTMTVGNMSFTDLNLERFYDCQKFLKGEIKDLIISKGFDSIKDEYISLRETLRKYYKFEYVPKVGLVAYDIKAYKVVE